MLLRNAARTRLPRLNKTDMKKFFTSKYFSTASAALLLFFGMTQFANAISVSSVIGDIGYVLVGKLAFGIAYLIAWIGGVSIAIEAWLVGAMLGLNSGVFQADIVQKGFGVTLSIANLGFVLGIIIIAIATILRSETYGYKKMLWKLIAAAILVNFSLVIAAPIFNLGNSFTTYFLNCIDPAGGGCNTQGSGLSSMNDFAANLAGAFNPQVGLITSASTTTNIPGSVALGQSFGQMLIPIFSIGFVAFELVAIAIVLGALIVMLLMRYLWIAMLAILMPFAWLGWVFPNIKDWWTKWWSNFIRWTFFAPIVVFFLWLAMTTMNSMRNGTAIASQQFGTYTSTSNPVWSAVSQFLTNAFEPIVAQSLNIFLMIGLTIGGMYVADKMSITGAKAGVDAAKSVGKGVQGYVGKKSRNMVNERLKTAGRRTHKGETTTFLQRFGSRLQSVPIPGSHGLGSAIAQKGTDTAHRSEGIEKYRKEKLIQLDNAAILSRATSSTAFADPIEAAAVGQELARRNIINRLPTPALINRFVSNSERMGNVQAILNNRPELAADTEAGVPRFDVVLGRLETAAEAAARAIRDAVRGIKNADIPQLDSRLLDSDSGAMTRNGLNLAQVETVAMNLNPSQLGALGSSGSPGQQRALTETARRMVAALPSPIVVSPRGAPVVTAPVRLPNGRINPDALPGFPPALRRMIHHMEQNSNWEPV